MPPNRAPILAWTITLMLLLGGCTIPFIGEPAAEPLPFTDIQVPMEMTLDEKTTLVSEGSSGRVGLLKASGRISAISVVQFYRESMAQQGWNEISEFTKDNQTLLVFKKGTRATAVNITEGWVYTEVEINVSAK